MQHNQQGYPVPGAWDPLGRHPPLPHLFPAVILYRNLGCGDWIQGTDYEIEWWELPEELEELPPDVELFCEHLVMLWAIVLQRRYRASVNRVLIPDTHPQADPDTEAAVHQLEVQLRAWYDYVGLANMQQHSEPLWQTLLLR